MRRLIVPRGHNCWWGVDPSTKAVSIATVDASGRRGVSTVPFRKGTLLGRLNDIYRLTSMCAADLKMCDLMPGVIVVEQPSGATQNLELVYAVGAILAALNKGYQGYILTVPSMSWKKEACGRGNIFKSKPPGEYGVLTWALLNGYTGWSWDEADAWGIAEYARKTIVLEEG